MLLEALEIGYRSIDTGNWRTSLHTAFSYSV